MPHALPASETSPEIPRNANHPMSPIMTRIQAFLNQDVPCCQRNCLGRIWEASQDELQQFGDMVAACSHEAKEAALLMNLREHLSSRRPRRTEGRRQRTHVAYTIAPFGRLCRQAYVVLWDIGVPTLQTLLGYMRMHANTFCPRTHGLTGASSNHALPLALQQDVITFILEVGDQVGEEDQGRHGRRMLQGQAGRVIKFLPASYTLAELYRLFLSRSRHHESGGHASSTVSFSAFRSLFLSEPCQHIRIRQPRSNVCDDCAMFRTFYRQHRGEESAHTSCQEEDHITQWQRHIQLAREAREAYNGDLRQARKTLGLLGQGKLPLAGYVAHYTFDFMQSLAIPQFADQTKDMYYLSLRNIHLFSIRDDGARIQHNYLYDEGEGGKGANYVVSLLFHFLCHRTHEAAAIVLHLHADNCSGQNKNNLMMQFFVLLVSLGMLTHVEMKFLIKGHTHCSVDGGHGLIKKAWRRHDVFTLEQAARIVETASSTEGVHRAWIVSAQDFFDWEHFLSASFGKLPHLLSFQQFEMDATRPGILRYRQHQTEPWQEHCLFKKKMVPLPADVSSMAAIQQHLTPLPPPGIPIKKQQTLYEKVRKYVPPAYQDVICPRPLDYQERRLDEKGKND
jgi:hypothetical protein